MSQAATVDSSLESERQLLMSRLRQDTDELRHAAISLRNEERRLLRQDSQLLHEVQRKVRLNQRRTFEQEVKYKSSKARDECSQKYMRWRSQAEAEESHRWSELRRERRLPAIRLDRRLFRPELPTRRELRRMYGEATRRPESRLGEKCLAELRLRARERMELEAGRGVSDFLATVQRELSPSQQQAAAAQVLEQIGDTLEAIQFWQLPPTSSTSQLLAACSRRTTRRRRRRRPAKANGEGNDFTRGETREKEGGDMGEQPPDTGITGRIRWRQAASDAQQLRRESTAAAAAAAASSCPAGADKRRQSRALPLTAAALAAVADARKRRQEQANAVWNEARKCRYIRGYEPPGAALPDDRSIIDFVFQD